MKPFLATVVFRVLRCMLPCGALIAMAGCAAIDPPEAWEKGTLAKPSMTMDQDGLEAQFVSHVYFSREAATGGNGVGGGGCGCN